MTTIDYTPASLDLSFTAGQTLQFPQYFPVTASNGTVTYLDPAATWSRVDLTIMQQFGTVVTLALSTAGSSPALSFGSAVVPIAGVNTTVPAILWNVPSAATAGIASGEHYEHKMKFTRISDGQTEYLFAGIVKIESAT